MQEFIDFTEFLSTKSGLFPKRNVRYRAFAVPCILDNINGWDGPTGSLLTDFASKVAMLIAPGTFNIFVLVHGVIKAVN